MASGETYLMLADKTIVGAANPLPTQGVAGATADIELHDHTTPTQWLKIDADGRVNLGAGATLNTGQAQTGLAGAVALILGANTHRRKIVISNLDGAHTVFIGKNNAVTITTGFGLKAGTSVEFETTSALYVISSNAADVVSYAEFAA